MKGEYRFFQEFFDGQIVKEESEKYKIFKLLLVCITSVLCIAITLSGEAQFAALALVVLGMIWNFYLGLNRMLSFVFAVIVSFIYFYYCCQFGIYANALIYVVCYIPFQLIATTKDYSEGDYVQIKKKITDLNKLIFAIFVVVLFAILYLLDYDFGARFIALDVLSATLLVASALLRNERYLEYYLFRFFALVSSIILWTMVALEFGDLSAVLIILMYLAYLIHDVVEFCVQNVTYESEETIQVNAYLKKREESLKLEEENLKAQKLDEYSKKKQPKKVDEA